MRPRRLLAALALLLSSPVLAGDGTADLLATLEQKARDARSDAVLIDQDGKTLLQLSTSPDPAPIHLMSATKSLVALAFALLLDEGRLASLDLPVHTIYPEWKQGSKQDITVRMLLDHTSGIQNVANAGVELEGAADLVQLALASELSSVPGSVFAYNNKATNLLPGIVQRLSGQPLDVYLQQRLFTPLGIRGQTWMKDAAGTPLGMAGVSLAAPDLVAIGRLLLDGGVTPQGRRLLSERSIELLTAESARSPEVGLLWWRLPAWERYRLKADAGARLQQRGVDAAMQKVLLAAQGTTFDSRAAVTDFVAQQLGPGWAARYGTEITARGLRLSDLFDVDRGPVVAYAANGYLGQHLVIVPGKRLVAVRQIHRRDDHRAPGDDYASYPLDVLRLAETL